MKLSSKPPPMPKAEDIGEAHAAVYARLSHENRQAARKIIIAVVSAASIAAGSYVITSLQDGAAQDVRMQTLTEQVSRHAMAPAHPATRDELIRIEGQINRVDEVTKTELRSIDRRLERIEGAVTRRRGR